MFRLQRSKENDAVKSVDELRPINSIVEQVFQHLDFQIGKIRFPLYCLQNKRVPCVARGNDNSVAKIGLAAHAVGNMSFVQYLQEKVENVRMCRFQFIQ